MYCRRQKATNVYTFYVYVSAMKKQNVWRLNDLKFFRDLICMWWKTIKNNRELV